MRTSQSNTAKVISRFVTVRGFIFRILAMFETTLHFVFSPKVVFVPTSKYSYPEVSIIIVVHNGIEYIKSCLNSLQKTQYRNFEVIVVDNASDQETREYLHHARNAGQIQKLILNKSNKYFSGGNNIGAKHSSNTSAYLLLLNSDTIINDSTWLSRLVYSRASKGITSFGFASIPFRPDGWCFLVSRELYRELGGISTRFKMNWGITDLTRRAILLKRPVRVLLGHKKFITHLGGKSYTDAIRKLQNKTNVNILPILLNWNWLKISTFKLN